MPAKNLILAGAGAVHLSPGERQSLPQSPEDHSNSMLRGMLPNLNPYVEVRVYNHSVGISNYSVVIVTSGSTGARIRINRWVGACIGLEYCEDKESAVVWAPVSYLEKPTDCFVRSIEMEASISLEQSKSLILGSTYSLSAPSPTSDSLLSSFFDVPNTL
eukprot:782599-Amorphochlora_amoeboformis.AAC.1